MSQPPPTDIFNILVATDVHLGYAEDDPIRGNDSFNTFEEILQIGQENEVDLILLAGDLFHITNPSTISMQRCMSLLRQYCMGDKPVLFEHLSDAQKNFANTTQDFVNFEDPNLNISVPVYSIHGNHDDPTGQNNICSLDILSCAGVVNFIGKSVDLKSVNVSPVLLQKGDTRLAVYGMSHINDKRLYRLFEDGKVTFEAPSEYEDDWFNILMVHQNRVRRANKEYLPEDMLPDKMSLVIWGHEHDCRLTNNEPEYNDIGNFHIIQPGSSVATSLSEGESYPKKVALVQVYKKDFRIQPVPLKTVRPFIFKTISASEFDVDEDLVDLQELLEDKATNVVYSMIEEAKERLTGHPMQPTLPLIRLRYLYSNQNEMFNAVRFGQKFDDLVANPSEIIKMNRCMKLKEKRDVLESKVMDDVLNEKSNVRVEDYIKKYFTEVAFEEDGKYSLNVLSVIGLNEAVTAFVDKQSTNAINETINLQFSKITEHLLKVGVNDNNIDDEIKKFYHARMQNPDEDYREVRKHLDEVCSNGDANVTNEDPETIQPAQDDDPNFDEDDVAEESLVTVRGRGRGRGRGSRGPRAARTARAPRGSRAASSSAGAASTPSSRSRGRAAPQPTLQQSFARASQLSVTRTSGRSTANKSRMRYVEDGEED